MTPPVTPLVYPPPAASLCREAAFSSTSSQRRALSTASYGAWRMISGNQML